MEFKKIEPGKNGEHYVRYEERHGNESTVYFTRDLSAQGILRLFERVNEGVDGKVAIKLHTGEKNGPNIIPSYWVKEFLEKCPLDATIVETNTYYEGDRSTTLKHRETLQVNGWDFCPVDILDEEGTALFPVSNGKWFKNMSVGSHLENYDSLLALTHFKGHTMGGFGGSNKNLGIGCADGRIGKKWIHTADGKGQWSIATEEFMERMSESAKSVVDHFAGHIAYINVMRNMSVSCDCEGCAAEKVVTPNVGILASRDILAVDQACVDLIYAMEEKDHHDLVERIQTRHGLRQLSYMKELGMGNDRYRLIDIDQKDRVLSCKEAVAHVVPFEE